MYQEGESIFYYITMYNEDYAMPAMPEGVRDGIVRGIYKVGAAKQGKAVAQLFAAVQFSMKRCVPRKSSPKNTVCRPMSGV